MACERAMLALSMCHRGAKDPVIASYLCGSNYRAQERALKARARGAPSRPCPFPRAISTLVGMQGGESVQVSTRPIVRRRQSTIGSGA